jgi:hypothetical protein
MIHIHRFVERLQGADARGSKEFSMAIRDAKDLHADITKLLLTLETLKVDHLRYSENNNITVEITGGKF